MLGIQARQEPGSAHSKVLIAPGAKESRPQNPIIPAFLVPPPHQEQGMNPPKALPLPGQRGWAGGNH